MTEWATLISLALTPLAILASLGVIVLWARSGRDALLQRDRVDRDYFILGVMIGFIGSLMDSIYWGIGWTLKYTSHPGWDDWLDEGALNNLIFRQGATALAAICHIKAGLVAESVLLRSLYIASAVGGLAFVWLLFQVRGA